MTRHNALRLAILASLATASAAHAQTTAAPPVARTAAMEEIVVTGTRVAERSAIETAVPVDVVSAETLTNTGVTELNQALSIALPSFNFPRPGLNDGTDTVRPATLRGLAPDQTLVLVNSKRRHSASLVNVNASIGRGSSAVDLNTIPTAAIRSVEVLRDGASAQYGSDAIAGVINIQLKEASDGGNVSVSYGLRNSSYTVPVAAVPAGANYTAPSQIRRDRNDGETTTVSAWKGLSLGSAGFLTLALEYKDQERTERGGYDTRRQYPALAGGAFDPREQTFNRFSAWYGEPDLEQLTFFANAGYDMSNGVSLYGWASYQDRDAVSGGFYRPANDTRNVIEIYPDGFLPQIAPEVTDMSVAGGAAWAWGNWQMDSSLVFGSNEMEFTIQNTLNRSLGTASGTIFDAGGFQYDQLVFNLSGVRAVEVGALHSPLNIAVGIEARQENYEINAGEPDSYRNGGVLLPLGGPGCTTPNAGQVAAGGCATASGSQVFPGFQPSDAFDEDRTAVGAYVDLEADLSEKLLGSVAVRVEDYSDFGSNVSGKLALRYDFNEAFALRGSVQNGFRAPSLQQQFFSSTATNFIGGVPFDVRTFPVSDPAARALGAKDLEAEESTNFSLGAVINLGSVTITVDAYRIDIDDRIVLSENVGTGNSAADAAVRNYLQSLGFVGVSGGRFFINGVDTETEGVDVVVAWPFVTETAGRFDFTLTGNWNSTDVTRIPTTNELSSLTPPPVLFARSNVLTFEEGTPKDKFSANVNWSQGPFGATLRATRYGKVLDPQNDPVQDFLLTDKTLLDLEVRFDVSDKVRLALGADNVLDEYPDAFPAGATAQVPNSRNTTGATSFSNYSPFGRSGRFVYGRLSVNF
jgi:iron complex outermembrane recepter protein